MEPLFLSLEEVLEIHRQQIERYGGASGVRDLSLLESAIAYQRARHTEITAADAPESVNRELDKPRPESQHAREVDA